MSESSHDSTPLILIFFIPGQPLGLSLVKYHFTFVGRVGRILHHIDVGNIGQFTLLLTSKFFTSISAVVPEFGVQFGHRIFLTQVSPINRIARIPSNSRPFWVSKSVLISVEACR